MLIGIGVGVAVGTPLLARGALAACGEAPDLGPLHSVADPRALLDPEREPRPGIVLLEPAGVDAMTTRALAVVGFRLLLIAERSALEQVVDLLRAGAVGYVPMDVEPDALVAALRQVAQGQLVIDPEVTRMLLARHEEGSRPHLTRREHDVLALVAAGYSNREIANRLYLCETTVKTHLAHVYEKLGTPRRSAAVARAMELQLLEI